jgi:hypothetical protein
MKNSILSVLVGVLAVALLQVGCRSDTGGAASNVSNTSNSSNASAPAMASSEQMTFATQDDAMKALLDAVQAQDSAALDRVLGPARQELMSGDKVADANALKRFATNAADQAHLESKGDAMGVLYVGPRDWPFPIPLEKNAQGRWYWDTPAGKEAILARRIGRNELDAIKVARAYVQAQREYASADRDGSDVLKYAQHFVSHAGKHDGLFWEAKDGEEESPLGPLMAQASAEGYGEKHAPFHGYYYHILTRQGPDAPGGKYDYVINGNMVGGFGMVAWPARYGVSGVMTFIVNQRGKVYQKDLGPDTETIARGMTEFNPDNTWHVAGE